MGCISSREPVPIPRPLSSLHRHEWLRWKKSFAAYMDHKGIPHCQRGEKFFKYIGFLGEELANKFYFAYTAHETKYEVLLFKYDVYFIFSPNVNIAKADYKNLKEYVSSLQNIAEKMGVKRVQDYVKEKILQNFKSIYHEGQDLIDRLKKLDLNISNYENLSIHELLFLWEHCNNLESIRVTNACRYCNLQHASGKCFAKGKHCWKCGEPNHFARCCQKHLILQCHYCGSSHPIKMCPASTKECSKCKRLNHFSWMCITEMVKNCCYCGQSHRSGRNYCPARNSTCMSCSQKGHYSSYCYHKKK